MMLQTRLSEGWNYKDLERLRRRKEWQSLVAWAKEQEWLTFLDFAHCRKDDLLAVQARAQVWDTLVNFLMIEPDKSLVGEEDND